jgi:deoxyribodipyrimidine photolyase-related protein
MRRLCLVLGDQLDGRSAIFDGFDRERDMLWMAEVDEEATHVWCHKLRIAYFFSCMRHFRDEIVAGGLPLRYRELPAKRMAGESLSFCECLIRDCAELKPEELVVVQPGDVRVLAQLERAAKFAGTKLTILEDRHFYESAESFADWAKGRKSLLLEHYYQHLRKKHNVLMTDAGKPVGGEWNFDRENRHSFGKSAPATWPLPVFRPDEITKNVIQTVMERFADFPGKLDHFDLPVTRADALEALSDFIENRLPQFGAYQDAMWDDEPFLNHSRLSAALNVKLISPQEVVDAAVSSSGSPLNSVEGFVRQLLGWREFVRGIYWLKMPSYAELNFFEANEELPVFFWDGETEMACVKDAMRGVIDHGYAHHIHRLMVLGLFAQLFGVHPHKFHQWHMAMYVDAVDWVSLPNALGMSQFGDGGIVGTKPYCASGNYINKMSNYCKGCRFKYNESTGENACPFTTFYWDFLARNEPQLRGNHRMAFQMKNLGRKRGGELQAIQARAQEMRSKMRVL